MIFELCFETKHKYAINTHTITHIFSVISHSFSFFLFVKYDEETAIRHEQLAKERKLQYVTLLKQTRAQAKEKGLVLIPHSCLSPSLSLPLSLIPHVSLESLILSFGHINSEMLIVFIHLFIFFSC
jgi:hypothetical protein